MLGMLEVIASDFARPRWYVRDGHSPVGFGWALATLVTGYICSQQEVYLVEKSIESRIHYEKIGENFRRLFRGLETDTKAAEAEAQDSFDKFSSESAVNRAANSKDVEHKTTKKTNQESALTAKKADLEGTQKELDAALAYYDKLKPSCVDAGVSYDDRVARRKEEIESLQEVRAAACVGSPARDSAGLLDRKVRTQRQV